MSILCVIHLSNLDYNFSLLRPLFTRPDKSAGFSYVFSPCGEPLGETDWAFLNQARISRKSWVPSTYAVQMARRSIPLADADGKSRIVTPLLNNALGATIYFSGGEFCEATQLPRSFTVALECSDTVEPPTAGESDTCKYWMKVRSPLACPLQCARDASGLVCGGRGSCKRSEIGGASCVCANGMEGPFCQPRMIANMFDGIVLSVCVLVLCMFIACLVSSFFTLRLNYNSVVCNNCKYRRFVDSLATVSLMEHE